MQAQKEAQPVFDNAKEKYQEAEKQALKAKDDALKQAQPVIVDGKANASEVGRTLGILFKGCLD